MLNSLAQSFKCCYLSQLIVEEYDYKKKVLKNNRSSCSILFYMFVVGQYSADLIFFFFVDIEKQAAWRLQQRVPWKVWLQVSKKQHFEAENKKTGT